MNFNIFLTTAVISSILITLGIVAGVILVLFLQKRLLKNELHLKKGYILIIYFITFLALTAAVLSLFSAWGFDLGTYISQTFDDVVTKLTEDIGRIITSLIIIFITFFILKFSKVAFKKIGLKEGPAQRRRKTVGKLLSSITRYTVGIIAIISVLSVWGVNVGPALAGLGIVGLVIGLGAQKFINDLIAGFFIIFEQHYDVDDVIEVQDFKGTVIDIGLKTTRIRNWKGEVKILANGAITNLTNFSRNPSVAVVEFGIAYEEDIQKTFDVLALNLPKFRETHPEITEDIQNLGVIGLSASSVDLRVIAKTLNQQHYATERALRKFIKDLLNEHNIEIPFPQVVVHNAKS